MVDGFHAERVGFLLEVPPDAAHAKDAERLALRVAAQRRRRHHPRPGAAADGQDAVVEAAQRREDEEHGRVGGGVVDDERAVRHGYPARRARCHVDVVVSGT